MMVMLRRGIDSSTWFSPTGAQTGGRTWTMLVSRHCQWTEIFWFFVGFGWNFPPTNPLPFLSHFENISGESRQMVNSFFKKNKKPNPWQQFGITEAPFILPRSTLKVWILVRVTELWELASGRILIQVKKLGSSISVKQVIRVEIHSRIHDELNNNPFLLVQIYCLSIKWVCSRLQKPCNWLVLTAPSNYPTLY